MCFTTHVSYLTFIHLYIATAQNIGFSHETHARLVPTQMRKVSIFKLEGYLQCIIKILCFILLFCSSFIILFEKTITLLEVIYTLNIIGQLVYNLYFHVVCIW